MDPGPDSKRITADSRLKEVVSRYPSTGPVLIQHGRIFVVRPGELQPSYPDLTIREYADLNGIPAEPLLRLLNAAAEAEEFARTTSAGTPGGEDRPSESRMSLPIGYTGSYQERKDPWDVAVVTVQRSRGP